jgi:hypothetical protein
MTIVTDTWRQLVQRRLWPVALLLLGALVAVPFFLSKSPEPAPVATAPATGNAKASAASADPIVSMVSDEDGAATRRSLGTRHNPFAASGPKKKVKKEKAVKTSDTGSQPAEGTSGEAPSSGGGIPAPTTPPAPAAPTKTIPAYSIDVRFGSSSDSELPRRTVERDEALPNEDEPVLVYLGVKNGGKTAVFMLSEGLTATGDGTCTPKETCETIELQAGETEFFDLQGDENTQYQLDVVKIHKHATKVPATDDASGLGTGSGTTGSSITGATASLKAGRRAVRAHVSRSGPLPYVYDRRSGTLRRR